MCARCAAEPSRRDPRTARRRPAMTEGPEEPVATVRDDDLRAFVETLPEIVFRTTPDGLIDYFSTAWNEYNGLSAEDSTGKRWTAPVHPDDVARALAAREPAMRREKPFAVELRIRGRDGAYRWFLTRATPVRDASGEIVHWYGTCTDIDVRKGVDEQFRAIAEAMPQMVWTALSDGSVDYVNAQVYAYTGAARDPGGW